MMLLLPWWWYMMMLLPWGQGQLAWFWYLGQTHSSTHEALESSPCRSKHKIYDDGAINRTTSVWSPGSVHHPLHHHHRQKQSLKAIQFHTCWSIPDELAYLKFSRIFSKTFGGNITQSEKIHDTRNGCGDFRRNMTMTRIWSPKIFKTFPMFCPNKDVDLPPRWSDAPKHWPTHALDKKPSAARRGKEYSHVHLYCDNLLQVWTLRYIYIYQLHNMYN